MTEQQADETAPEPVAPDTKDWTWVLERPCPECGFDPASVVPTSVPRIIVEASDRFGLALEEADAGVRTTPGVWSTVEYGQHVADVLEVMTDRLGLILDAEGAGASFADWDQDAAAVEKEYWKANTHVTAILIKERAAAAAEAWGEPTAEQWEWSGRRGDGVTFTAAALGRYLVHDLLHHLHDVDA
ncbi:DinB family protein [Propioniciclava sinopodophylli]|uniref:DinB family protein n=1 Tax=Propioniciclava sinopodophylli TaxID=1837344 RepID=A0A4Q9KBR7_9ACTN|nr:DinB family protein [Propioniciclava sinopodophylli]TBT83357.1 DinB family protein [Propioniciclava sinopodophylli]